MKKFLTLAMFAMVLSSCEKEDSPPEQEFSVDIFYKNMSTLSLELAYESGATPYTETVTGYQSWKFTECNIESLFANRPIALDVIVPYELNQMTLIPHQNKTSYTADNIKTLAVTYRNSSGNETDGNIFVLFLNGYFFQNDSINYNVLGVHLTGTTLVSIFKPAISLTPLSLTVKHFTEQSVVVHEIGHALGFVNNGLPMITSHEDSEHHSHCSNHDCVMYWQNEQTLGFVSLIQDFRDGKKIIIFGPECIVDAQSYLP